MSVEVTALRFQAIEALNSDPVIDGMVQGRIYDSRISAFDHREPVPTIIVTSDETKGEAWSQQNGGAPFGLVCDLVLEIAMNAVGPIELDGQTTVEAIGYAATDRELEAELDLLVHRAIEILTRGETAAAALLRSAVVKRVPSFASSRFSTDQIGEKFAARLVTLRVHLFTPQDPDPFEVATGPYACLPEPLRAICEASAPDGSVRSTCDLLMRRMAPAAPADPDPIFTGVDMALAPQSPNAADPPDRAFDEGAGRLVAADLDPPPPT